MPLLHILQGTVLSPTLYGILCMLVCLFGVFISLIPCGIPTRYQVVVVVVVVGLGM